MRGGAGSGSEAEVRRYATNSTRGAKRGFVLDRSRAEPLKTRRVAQDCDPKAYMYTPSGRKDALIGRFSRASTVAPTVTAHWKANQHSTGKASEPAPPRKQALDNASARTVRQSDQNFPMPALVGADATDATSGFEVCKMLLDCATRHHQRINHSLLRKTRISLEQR